MSLRPSQLRASAAETAMMIPMAWSLQRQQRSMSVPTVVVAGADDRLLSTEWSSTRLHERLPHSELRIVPGSGHMVHHTAPQAVMAAIDRAAALARERADAIAAATDPAAQAPDGQASGLTGASIGG